MNLDYLLNRTYHDTDYNCGHHVRDVWLEITGEDITELMQGFLRGKEDRSVPYGLRRGFTRLDSPQSPCIVLFTRRKAAAHVGVYYKRHVHHIDKTGAQYLPLDVVRIPFVKERYYKPCHA